MNYTSRTITGIMMIIFGLGLMAIPIFSGVEGFISWIYGVPLLILGIFILFNKKEDYVEEIKTKSIGGKK